MSPEYVGYSVNGGSDNSGSPPPDSHQAEEPKPQWTTARLTSTLKKPTDFDEDPSEETTFGWPQVILMAVTFFMMCFVAGCTMMSKLSFLSLAEKFQLAAQKKDGSPESHAALLLMGLTMLLPQGLGVVQGVWYSCYKSRRSNPNPSMTSVGYILLVAMLEATGLSLYVLVVVPQVPSALCLVIMNGVFSVPALMRCLGTSGRSAADRKLRGVDEPLLGGPDNPTAEEYEALPVAGLAHRSLLWVAMFAQLGAIAYIPMYMLANGGVLGAGPGGIDTAVLTSAAMIMISVAWLPSLQDRMVVPSDPNHRFNARLKAGLLCSLFKVGVTIAWMAILIKNVEGYDLDQLGNGLDAMSQSNLLLDFVVHILSSHFGYHAARMACAMSIQPLGFALPMTLVTPLTLAVVFSSCRDGSAAASLFVVQCLGTDADTAMLIVIAVVLWASQNVIVARNAWNSRSPLLAMEEMLFYQPSYNSVLLEQYTLLNRREPDPTTDTTMTDDPDDPSVRVYICSTVYRESPAEMKQLIQSALRVDRSVRNVFEWHVWMDGGCTGNQLGQYAIQFVACLKEEVERLGDIEVKEWIESGQKMETPYGQRLEWLLPDGTPFALHLKDAALVKRGKRWSQVMYMYYLLQFRVPRDHPLDTSASYILTTDADIIFTPKDVQALVVLLSRNKRVGACCGRTYPKGSGPVFWYQVFDYAVGHWFQKTSEHVLGTVLCCPGCFSLYRIDALRDCLLKYSSSVTEAFDFLTKDMGEDRWLCTLLVMNGWRLDYTAVSSNTTFCPESFDEFFNQRRRWIVSTLANQVELLSNWRRCVNTNDSVSVAFIIYQVGMIFSSMVAPATTILVIMGGVKYSFESNLDEIMIWLFGSVLVYFGILLTCTREMQLLASKVYTGLFAILMGAVIVGVATQIADEIENPFGETTTPAPYVPNRTVYTTDDPYADEPVMWRLSVTTVYLAGMVAIFIIAAAVHPTEAVDVLYGVLYLLCLPGGYLVLMLYAFVNLDDRSWGTRTEALRKKEIGSAIDGMHTMLRGCGIWEDETLAHFFGRLLTCRCHNPPPESKDTNPYLAITTVEHKPRVNDKVWVLNEDGSSARCAPVDRLLEFLARHESEEDLGKYTAELVALTREALHACPSLSSWGQWTRCWHAESQSFRIPRGKPTESDPRLWRQMREEIAAHMDTSYTWSSVVDKKSSYMLPDGHKKIGPWLEGLGLSDPYLVNIFLQHGYDDSTFVIGLGEEDFRELGMPSTLTGRANIRKLVEAVRKLPNNDIPDTIPPTLSEWLDALCLGVYANNFERCGYGDGDLALCEGLTSDDLHQMGIIKQGHLNKLLKAVEKLTALLIQGRSPEGKSAAMLKVAEIRELVSRLPESSLEATYFAPRLVLSEEQSFWTQAVTTKLDPKLESISNVNGLKQKLRHLRNVAVIVLFMLNALWILLMVELAQEQTASLNIFHTNPLGFVFLMVYGTIFFVQFLSMMWHRLSTAVQYIASVPFPSVCATASAADTHRYAAIRA